MHAVAFGSDGTAGDSQFTPDPFEIDNIDSVMERWKANEAKLLGIGITPGEYSTFDEYAKEEEIEMPVGFWVIDDKFAKAVKNAEFETGSDSALYSACHGLKCMIAEMAVETITVD